MKSMKTQTILKSRTLQETKIEIGGKEITAPFFTAMPQSGIDLQIICDIYGENIEQETMPNFGGMTYRIFEHDKIIRIFKDKASKYVFGKENYQFIYETQESRKLKLLDPATELYRHRYQGYIKEYKSLERIPSYLQDHFQQLLDSDVTKIDDAHASLWQNLEEKTVDAKNIGRTKSAHFLKWHEQLQQRRNATILLPPTPHITLFNSKYLLQKAIEINMDAYDLSQMDCANFFSFEPELFQSRDLINSLLSYIDSSDNKSKVNIFKIPKLEKIVQSGFGIHAKKNLEVFLKSIKSIKEENTENPKIFGLLSTGGIGYCFVGAGFDFFTDTVGNFAPYPVRPPKIRAEHRKILHPVSLVPEKFNSAIEYWKDEGVNPLLYLEEHKDATPNDIFGMDSKQWSYDARKNGVLLWNEAIADIKRGIRNGKDSMFFDRIQNSDFAILASIVRKVAEF